MTYAELLSWASTWKARHAAQDLMLMCGREAKASENDILSISQIQEAEGGEKIPALHENVTSAKRLIDWEFQLLVTKISESSRRDFFHPCNRDDWMDTFITQLHEKYQKPDRIASND